MLNHNFTTTETAQPAPRKPIERIEKKPAIRERHTSFKPPIHGLISGSWRNRLPVKDIADQWTATQANVLDVAMHDLEDRILRRLEVVEDALLLRRRFGMAA